MDQPEELQYLVNGVTRAVTNADLSTKEVKIALEHLLVWLLENDTDENCRKVEWLISEAITCEQRNRLPEPLLGILDDMGSTLHDTHSAPEVATNFSSTPRQLLERLRSMRGSMP